MKAFDHTMLDELSVSKSYLENSFTSNNNAKLPQRLMNSHKRA
jgi:hypothetical protein